MPVLLGCAALVAVLLSAAAGRYFYSNLHYDEGLAKQISQAGFTEKKAVLPDGSVVNYGEGPDSGPALLLIHGQSVEWEDYAPVLPGLSRKFHVFAVDCYGHGQSSHDPSLYSCGANGEALVRFIDGVVGESCFVSGHSSGGILAAWLAANAPRQVRGVVLEDPPLFEVTPGEMQEGKGCFAWKDSFVTIHSFLNQDRETDYDVYYLENGYMTSLFGGLKGPVVRAAKAYRKEHPGQPLKISWLPHAWLRAMHDLDDFDLAFAETFYDGSWMRGIDQEAMLREIRCPAVYLKASTNYGKDGVLYAANTEADAEKVQSLIAGCERIDVKSGHDIHVEQPQTFLSACEKLLKD